MDVEKMALLADIALNDPSKAAEIFASMGIPVPQPGQQMPGVAPQQPLFGGGAVPQGAPAAPQPQPQAAPTQAAAPVVPPGVPPTGQPGLNNLDQILMQAFQPQASQNW